MYSPIVAQGAADVQVSRLSVEASFLHPGNLMSYWFSFDTLLFSLGLSDVLLLRDIDDIEGEPQKTVSYLHNEDEKTFGVRPEAGPRGWTVCTVFLHAFSIVEDT